MQHFYLATNILLNPQLVLNFFLDPLVILNSNLFAIV